MNPFHHILYVGGTVDNDVFGGAKKPKTDDNKSSQLKYAWVVLVMKKEINIFLVPW